MRPPSNDLTLPEEDDAPLAGAPSPRTTDRMPAAGPRNVAAASAPTGPLAEVVPLPAGEAQKVLAPANLRVATSLTLMPIPIGLLGGFGLVVLGISFANVSQGITAVCVVSGIATAVLSVVCLLHFQKFLASHYLRRVARRAFAQRTGALARFEDADAEFLEIIPRHAWQTFSLEPQSDIGLMRIDSARRELLFEGDRKRYRIPFDSVTRCEVEEIRLASDRWGTDLHFAVVLEAETTEGSRELPLFTRHLELASRRMRERMREADLLCERLSEAIS
jgi:hypothetical protein